MNLFKKQKNKSGESDFHLFIWSVASSPLGATVLGT